MADFIDSSQAIQTPRIFPRGCGPSAPKTGAAFKWLLFRPQTLTPKRKQPPSDLPEHKPQLISGSRHCVFALKAPILGGDRAFPVVKAPIVVRRERVSQLLPAKALGITRERVLGILEAFRRRCAEEQLRSKGSLHRFDLKAFTDLKEEESAFLTQTRENAKLIGSVPGVEVEDRFKYRAELMIPGLHRRLQNGIDWGEYRGRKVATCVVANEGSYDRLNDPDLLVYRGEGGSLGRGWEMLQRRPDQEMKGGNLALKNSSEVRNEVRVVRGLRFLWNGVYKVVYVYDGLYEVVGWDTKRADEGNMVFEFEMKRKPGQPRINWKKHTYF